MEGDFSRDGFDPAKHFARVLQQPGRVLTDADFNEQAAIQRELLRAFVVDLVGRRWRMGEGFAIGGATADDFTIGAGRCWLGGLPFDNDEACRYRMQPAGAAPAVTAADEPALGDPALGGVDPSVGRVRRKRSAAQRARLRR